MDEHDSLHSIDRYKGAGKWCFAIGTNRAWDNYQQRPDLFAESLLRYEKATRRDWFDEETRSLIQKASRTTVKRGDTEKVVVAARLEDLRNYFSHSCHDGACLNFPPDDDIRRIMERAYEKAIFEVKKRFTKETDLETVCLFEPGGRITAPGVVFLCSFFVERRILNRLMGYVAGFKRTEGEYKIRRAIFSTYCLRDSHSIQAGDPNAAMFRDILGYLSHVPREYYRHNTERCDTEKQAQRGRDKFISLSLRYLETVAFGTLRNYTACFGQTEIVREEPQKRELAEEEYRIRPPKARVRVVFGQHNVNLAYYVNHNTVILKTGKKGGTVHNCKVGVNELKYLVLLCLRGKTEAAIAAIDGYVQRIQARFHNPSAKSNRTENPQLVRGLPGFVRIASGIDVCDKERARKARFDHVRQKWERKKAESPEAELHRKARDVIRYVNWQCCRPLSVEEYNRLFALLINKDLPGFGNELQELKRCERISEEVRVSLECGSNLNVLHAKVCDLVLAELDHLAKNDQERLDKRIGLMPREEKEGPSYEQKVRAFVEQPMIYRGFLRDVFFSGERRTFAKLVEETLQRRAYPDVPLGSECYHVSTLGRFDKDNSVLYETLARDRLCVMIARECYERLNSELRRRAQGVSWEKNGATEILFLEFPKQPGSRAVFQIRFAVTDYPKLYVMDDVKFLTGLMKHFFAREDAVDYHTLYSQGIHKYTTMQQEGIAAIFRLEEKVIKDKSIPTPACGYIGFAKIMAATGYQPAEKEVLTKVRNSLLHYLLDFEPSVYARFCQIMRREGFENEKRTRMGKR
jgi:hypothetical protein